jgi:hypothetical protein
MPKKENESYGYENKKKPKSSNIRNKLKQMKSQEAINDYYISMA